MKRIVEEENQRERRTKKKVATNKGMQDLKVPKREIFVTELFILSNPIWIGDLRNEPKNRFV